MLTRFIVCTIVFFVVAGYVILLCERPKNSRDATSATITVAILAALGGLVMSLFQT